MSIFDVFKPKKVEMVLCPKCKKETTREEMASAHYVCPCCGRYLPMGAWERIEELVDPHSFIEFDRKVESRNVLDFPGYEEKLEKSRESSGISEAVVTGRGRIDGMECVLGVMDSHFMMGSMSSAVGEKITRAIEYAEANCLPLILFSASGGARMQEGIFSLMQMAKTSSAIAAYGKKGLPYISVLTNPTTGGVTASFASLGDIMLAEPGALIGFAGPRVIEQTIGQALPEGFQRSEFQMDHGFVDEIVERKDMKKVLSRILRLHRVKEAI